MKVLLVNNNHIAKTIHMAEGISAQLQERGIAVEISDGRSARICPDCDYIIVLGGDGTLIRTARKYLVYDKPILGVNLGTVGFLSNLQAGQLNEYLDSYIKGQFSLDLRMMMEIKIFRENTLEGQFFSLNEISIKSAVSKIVKISIDIDGERQSAYRGDGIIVATPTGSTAYSLSSGGPIVDPDLEAFIITPIAANSFRKKPLVVSARKKLALYLPAKSDLIYSIDGQERGTIDNNCVITISQALHRIRLVNLNHSSFFGSLDERLKRREV